jgi:RNA polymerase sigma-70 factor, ECF subfamily
MPKPLFQNNEINYRALYGKLFSALFHKFGVHYVAEIEDAIQNTFLKSLKIWKQHDLPNNRENWLFIVARNDVLNQIKRNQKLDPSASFDFVNEDNTEKDHDLRLHTILFIAGLNNISTQAKIILVLKNIFGLSQSEIQQNTLLSQDAIYKSIIRSKKIIQEEYGSKTLQLDIMDKDEKAISIVEEILYSTFNIGFDSFNEKSSSIINTDLCLEAIALAKSLYTQFGLDSTSNLLAIFCLHSARIPAKVENGKLISFFKQNRTLWDQNLHQLGVHYLRHPKVTSKFYIEALIILKYMSSSVFTNDDWKEIIKLYQVLMKITNSPIVKLNYCFCLSKVNEIEEALIILKDIEKGLPNEHVYLAIVKAKIMQNIDAMEAKKLFTSIADRLEQKIRKDFLLENELMNSD